MKFPWYQKGILPNSRTSHLRLSWACNAQSSRAYIISSSCQLVNLEKQNTFKPGQMYVALSRIRNLQGLFLTSIFCKEAIKASAEASKEYDRLLNTAVFISALVAPSYNSLFSHKLTQDH